MATEIIMPKVDMVMDNGTFVEWLKKEGDAVKKGESIFVLLTDKATIEAESPADGILAGLNAKKDDVIPVTTVIGYVLAPGEKLPEKAASPKPAAAPAPMAPAVPVAPAPAPVSAAAPAPLPMPVSTSGVRATPLARAMAKDRSIDLTQVPGRGPRGRIYKSDIEAYEKQAPQAALTAAAGAALPTSPVALPPQPVVLPNAKVRERIPLKGIRALIAQRMSYNAQTIPHIYETVNVDMTEMVHLREKVAPALLEATGQKVTYTAILVEAVARVLKQYPTLNSSLVGNEVVVWDDVHMGVATSLEDYLIVPVVRDSDKKDLKTIVEDMARLLAAARSHKLEPSEMSGSTFTISNLGMFGVESFTAIINSPETAILAVGKMQDMPVAVNGKVEVRPMMTLTIGVDHRVNDGAQAGKFLKELKNTLENPYLLL
ncbi:MAG: dihydrolipoamide acetyltransferase family protein [Anaerolineaceae bacterium]|jgi:pyruvate dehydrogenase E2 component (dihydrolipoamide acetyltransferase)